MEDKKRNEMHRVCTDKDNGRCYPAARIIKWPACRERNRVPKKMLEEREGADIINIAYK